MAEVSRTLPSRLGWEPDSGSTDPAGCVGQCIPLSPGGPISGAGGFSFPIDLIYWAILARLRVIWGSLDGLS
jgi:hypothetical protein